jgi:hypothetical protein
MGWREHRLNDVIGKREDGTPVLVRERILEWISAGIPYDTSILRANVSLSTAQRWMKEAAKAEELSMTNPLHKLSAYQRDLVVFSRQLENARAEGEAKFHEAMHKLAEGDLASSTTVVKMVEDATAPGGFRVVERSVKTERTLPHFAAIRWVLENRYGRRLPTELVWRDTLTGALSDDEGVDALIAGAEAYLSQRETGGGSTNGHH